ncbi:hypothetical protein BO83DRAFT_387632 [Aspergillus eucalypticola CBS 122712]|uniref:Uncharacterized protein n=1 Tax=Aspergillus eucalypticola (strain CBS 122712 / IBT 29274) TaxID=1448314 RepID=A0A317VMN9_ASPEC|nr:uncharacterized protein BO83DRAFT_387632 [Aspergillus eucalypticola CBS 122712]PWY75614.1 hypothetical protein BO83DRAFT_387632 [Aspergillus eucalypticola CBS 122712]
MPTSDKTTVPNKETSNPIAKDDQIEILVYQAAVESQAALSTARRLIEIFNNLLRNVRDPGERPRLSAHFGRCVTSNGLLWRIGSSKSRGISAGQAAQECYDSMPYVTDINNPDGERKRRIMGCKDVTEKIDEMETETYKWFTDLSGDWQNFLGYWPPSSEVDEMRALYGHCIAKFLAFWQAIRNANQEAPEVPSISPCTETVSLIPTVPDGTRKDAALPRIWEGIREDFAL